MSEAQGGKGMAGCGVVCKDPCFQAVTISLFHATAYSALKQRVGLAKFTATVTIAIYRCSIATKGIANIAHLHKIKVALIAATIQEGYNQSNNTAAVQAHRQCVALLTR
ncbi:MAG: hypothetical protein Q4A37_00580 [Candidatus Saccharibacteria bacterium]|nr:hypothetical protein [Candidatus Saccharibacteria bacterium]